MELGFNEYSIEEKIKLLILLNGYKPLTFSELKNLTTKKHKEILSVCWKNGKFRCSSIGIENLKFDIEENELISLQYSDGDGDTVLENYNMNTEINNIGNGEWNYGLYIKI